MERKNVNLRLLVGALLLAPGSSALAQVADEAVPNGANGLEEVVVTALKREQNLRDVPVSLAVFSGDEIDRNALLRLEDLSALSPAFTVTEAAIATLSFVRGLGSGINQGFEQSVGRYVDGVYTGRGRQYRTSFLDIERVELLRGPQGILFGKNTIAGAINVTTAQPGSETEALLSARAGFDHGEYMGTAVLSGAFNEQWSARLAAQRGGFDGWMDNSANGGREEAGVEDTAVRGTLRWDPADALDLTLKLEHSEYVVDGRSTQITNAGAFTGLYQAFDPAFESRFDLQKSTGGIGLETSTTKHDLAVLTANYDWRNLTFTSISAWSAYDYLDLRDVDFGPVPYLFQNEPQDFSQLSQELRVATDVGGAVDFIGGLYFESSELDHRIGLDVDLSWLGIPLPPATRFTDFEQDTSSWAVFGQATWNLSEALRLSAGLRYTDERKTADQALWFADFQTMNPNPPLGAAYAQAGFGVPHAFRQTRNESHVSPSLTLQYDASETVTFYGTVNNGFKAGGFNAAEDSGNLDNFEFDNEESWAFEAGSKMLLLDGAAQLNVAAFYSDFKDLQVSSFEGVSFVVGNAAQAISQGLEVDGQWRISRHFTLGGAWTWLDSSYDDFRNASCTIEQTVSSGIGALCVQDLSGRSTQYAPRNSGRLVLAWEHQLRAGHGFDASLSVVHSDGFYIDQDLDSNTFQQSYQKLDLLLGWTSPGRAWRASLLARNLGDELTRHHASDVPLLAGAFYSLTDRPRSFTLQLDWRY
jgi:outer membrane receptor protein involved in Fe transport